MSTYVRNMCGISAKKQKLPWGSMFHHFENMTENVQVCFEVHIEKN